jgi:hypothetical protein
MIARLLLALLLALMLGGHAGAQTTVIYSRADAVHAERAARLARVFGPVIIDTALPPGVPWRTAIAAGICSSAVVLLIWSRRAAASTEVAREIATAQACRVPVLPVLLDSAPLPDDIGRVQGVDWR